MESLISGLLEASVAVITQLKWADKPQFLGKKISKLMSSKLWFSSEDRFYTDGPGTKWAQNLQATKAPKVVRDEQELQKLKAKNPHQQNFQLLEINSSSSGFELV